MKHYHLNNSAQSTPKIPQTQLLLVISLVFILISLVFRLNFSKEQLIITPDSESYFWRAQALHNQLTLTTFINVNRTPLYPLLMNFVYSHEELLQPSSSLSQLLGSKRLIAVQSMFMIILTPIVFIFLFTLTKKYLYAIFGTFLISFNPLLFPWEHAILTESISISWSILFSIVLVYLAKKLSAVSMIFYLIICILGMLLRPAFIPLIFLSTFAPLFFRYPLKRIIRAWAVLFVSLLAAFLLYIIGNGYIHQFPVYQAVTGINLLGRILQYDIPVSLNESLPVTYQIQQYQLQKKNPNPFYFLQENNANYNNDNPYLAQLNTVTQQTFLSQPFRFILSIFPSIPESITTIPQHIMIMKQTNVLFYILQRLILFISILAWITPLIFLFLSIKVKSLSFTRRIVLLFWGLSIFSVATNILFGYEDYARLNAPILPILFIANIISLPFFITLISKITQSITSKYQSNFTNEHDNIG